MKFDVTKQEYLELIKLLFLGEWMCNAYKISPEINAALESLRYTFFSQYKEMGAEQYINHNEQFDDYFENEKLGSELYATVITDYNNHMFWEELINRLAERHMIECYGQDIFESMMDDNKFDELDGYKEHLAKLFSIKGLDCIQILNDDKINQH